MPDRIEGEGRDEKDANAGAGDGDGDGPERRDYSSVIPPDPEPEPVTVADVAAERLSDLPPRCKLVYVVLDHDGPLTARQLKEHTRATSLASTRQAIRRLRDETDILRVESHPECSQRHIYSIDYDELAAGLPESAQADDDSAEDVEETDGGRPAVDREMDVPTSTVDRVVEARTDGG
jgi:hypothetical protein